MDPPLALDEPLFIATPSSNGCCYVMRLKLIWLLIGLVSLTLVGQAVWYRGTGRQGLMVQTSAVTAAWQHSWPSKTQQLAQVAAWPRQPAHVWKGDQQRLQPAKVWQPLHSGRPQQFRNVVLPAASAVGLENSVSAEAQKALVLQALDVGSDADVRAALSTALPALVTSNPTQKPAYSHLLTGKWTVRYMSSPAPKGLDVVRVKELFLDVSKKPSESIATIALRLPGRKQEVDVEVVADLRADGPKKLIERPKGVRFKGLPWGMPVPFLPVLPSREIFVQYVDNDLLVVSDARGSPGSPDILIRA